MSEARHIPPTAVLVVHGIGAQKPGESLEKLWSGIRRAFPELPENLRPGETLSLTDPAAHAECRVRFYEVYWADLLTGKRVKGSFDVNEFSSLAWFPFFNKSRGAYAAEPYSILRVLFWTLVLPVVGFAAFLTYWGAVLPAQMIAGARHRHEERPEMTFMERVRAARELPSSVSNVVNSMLDDYAGDIFNYVNSAGQSFPPDREIPENIRDVYREIVERFYRQLAKARDDGCERIQVVAHSLGTVVTYHALRGLRFDESAPHDQDAVAEACGRVEHIYTIGSPLEKIRFFWPRLRPNRNLVGDRTVAWDNFVAYFDPVAGVLRRYTEWGTVANHRLLGGGFLSAHVAYERSAPFLEALTRGLVGNPVKPERTLKQKFSDWALLLGETLAAPLGLVALLISGAFLWTLLAAGTSFMLSLPFRPFVAAEILGPIEDGVSLFIGGMMLLVFLIMPVINASRAIGRAMPEDH